MVKYLCDVCKKETDRKDLHILRIEEERSIVGPTSGGQDYTFTPVIAPKEVCVFCQQKIIEFLNKLEEGVE